MFKFRVWVSKFEIWLENYLVSCYFFFFGVIGKVILNRFGFFEVKVEGVETGGIVRRVVYFILYNKFW